MIGVIIVSEVSIPVTTLPVINILLYNSLVIVRGFDTKGNLGEKNISKARLMVEKGFMKKLLLIKLMKCT